MKTLTQFVAGCIMLLSLPMNLYAWEPNAQELGKTVKSGDFAGYLANISTWLNKKMPADPAGLSKATLETMLKDPVFARALSQRQFISKAGAGTLAGLVKTDESYKTFLAWILQNTDAMENCIEGMTPVSLGKRASQSYSIHPDALRRWKAIFDADPESKKGIYLRLAIAIGQSPPGTGNRGAGQTNKPQSFLERYQDYKAAHKKGELVPSFDNLTTWECRQVTCSNASNADLVWAREMLRTWRPDLTMNDLAVNCTSEVWRRNSPVPFNNTFRNVLAGGGKCGPRSSWAVFICQAFGLPTFGVRQPRHACACYKSGHPETQPQPGLAWKVVYGKGWQASKLLGMSGTEFIKAATIRTHAKIFLQVERLRWLASALTSKEHAAAIMKVAKQVGDEIPAPGGMPQNWKPDAKAVAAKKKPVATPVEEPFKKVSGVIHVEAESFSKSAGVHVHDCFTGGKQVYSPKYGANWGTHPRIEYVVEVPETGVYGLTMRTAVVNFKQSIDVAAGAEKPVSVKITNTHGMWGTTPEVEVRLEKGTQTLTLTRPALQRGLALRWLELKSK